MKASTHQALSKRPANRLVPLWLTNATMRQWECWNLRLGAESQASDLCFSHSVTCPPPGLSTPWRKKAHFTEVHLTIPSPRTQSCATSCLLSVPGTVLGRGDPIQSRRWNFCSLERRFYVSQRKDAHRTRQNVLGIDNRSKSNKPFRMYRGRCW